jgi:hypothetical protein
MYVYNYKFHVQALGKNIQSLVTKCSKGWSEYIICSHKFLISSDRGARITKQKQKERAREREDLGKSVFYVAFVV